MALERVLPAALRAARGGCRSYPRVGCGTTLAPRPRLYGLEWRGRLDPSSAPRVGQPIKLSSPLVQAPAARTPAMTAPGYDLLTKKVSTPMPTPMATAMKR